MSALGISQTYLVEVFGLVGRYNSSVDNEDLVITVFVTYLIIKERVMGERESSVVNLEDDLENDPSYLVAKEVVHRLKPIENRFLSKSIDRDSYFKEVDVLKGQLLEQNDGYLEDQSIIELVCDSSLIINSACQRLSREAVTNEKNLALVEAGWQIGLARYFLQYKSQPATVLIVNFCLDRLSQTLEKLTFVDAEDEGIVRGVRGLLATVSVLEKSGHEIEFPTPKQDAEEKIDLISVKGEKEEKQRYFWQIKTVAVDRNPLVIGIDKKQFDDPDNRGFVSAANALFNAAQKAEAASGLTTKAIYITIPEPQISSRFEPRQIISNSINSFLENENE
ncbi:hypothetical protein KKE14_01685 [Patescibacteria group bacterium]|nr:hypothetical protein [Patescibacteria group bacterium]